MGKPDIEKFMSAAINMQRVHLYDPRTSATCKGVEELKGQQRKRGRRE
jgi:hypothetical protein